MPSEGLPGGTQETKGQTIGGLQQRTQNQLLRQFRAEGGSQWNSRQQRRWQARTQTRMQEGGQTGRQAGNQTLYKKRRQADSSGQWSTANGRGGDSRGMRPLRLRGWDMLRVFDVLDEEETPKPTRHFWWWCCCCASSKTFDCLCRCGWCWWSCCCGRSLGLTEGPRCSWGGFCRVPCLSPCLSLFVSPCCPHFLSSLLSTLLTATLCTGLVGRLRVVGVSPRCSRAAAVALP